MKSLHSRNILSLGSRNFDEPNVPFKSRFGNKLTTAVFYSLYGKMIHDTQTGLRGIPNAFIKECLTIEGERFEYEIRMLISAARGNLSMVEVPIQTLYFDDNRETHFHPVKDSIRIYRVLLGCFFKFLGASLLCFAVDQGLFALLEKIVLSGFSKSISIPAATLGARAASSLLNYTLNRSVVFQSGGPAGRTAARYYTLCVLQMAVSAACVTVLNRLTGLNASILKLFVDTLLFFVSYRIQQTWVFGEAS